MVHPYKVYVVRETLGSGFLADSQIVACFTKQEDARFFQAQIILCEKKGHYYCDFPLDEKIGWVARPVWEAMVGFDWRNEFWEIESSPSVSIRMCEPNEESPEQQEDDMEDDSVVFYAYGSSYVSAKDAERIAMDKASAKMLQFPGGNRSRR